MNLVKNNLHWLIRLTVAATFIYHGLPKLTNLSATAEMMQLPLFLTLAVALFEILGGIGTIIGPILNNQWITRISGAMLAWIMINAIIRVHLHQGWSGMEWPTLLLFTNLNWVLNPGHEK